MIRAFLFDIGNVLMRFDFFHAASAVAPFCDATDAADVMRRMESVKYGYEDGQVSRAEFLQKAFAALGYRGTEAQFIAAWQGIFTENGPMTALVDSLHGKFPLYLLSNTNDMHVEGLFRDFPVFAKFTGATYSHEAKASKPHRPIYEIACRAHGIDPRTTFFIDDLAANIATARELGFQAHHYHHERHGELLDALRGTGFEPGCQGCNSASHPQ
ncbi:MAG: HAD family phosphatase [Chthoniobacteraceae bacterium]